MFVVGSEGSNRLLNVLLDACKSMNDQIPVVASGAPPQTLMLAVGKVSTVSLFCSANDPIRLSYSASYIARRFGGPFVYMVVRKTTAKDADSGELFDIYNVTVTSREKSSFAYYTYDEEQGWELQEDLESSKPVRFLVPHHKYSDNCYITPVPKGELALNDSIDRLLANAVCDINEESVRVTPHNEDIAPFANALLRVML